MFPTVIQLSAPLVFVFFLAFKFMFNAIGLYVFVILGSAILQFVVHSIFNGR